MRIRTLRLSVLRVLVICLLLAAAPMTADDNPVLMLEKTSNVPTYDAVDDVITYTYMATNAGNVALDDVTIDDPLPGLSALTCTPLQPATLNLAESMTCMATFTIAQADLDAGSVVNTATVDSSQTDPVDDTVTVIVAPMFIAIGDQILRAPKTPTTTDPAVETIEIFQEDGVTFNGLVHAGDGLLYACAEGNSGPKIFRFDPVNPGAVEIVEYQLWLRPAAAPSMSTARSWSPAVRGGIWRLRCKVAGMCLDELSGEVDFCFPYGSPGAFPAAEEITGSDNFGPVADVAFFYNSDFLSVVAASSGGGHGQGQGQGQGGGGSKGQLLRSIWPAYQSGFVTEGCPPDPLTKNTKILLDDLGAPTSLALSNGDIFVTDGKDLVRVDIPDPTGPFPACGEEPVATIAACESFGNVRCYLSRRGRRRLALWSVQGSRNKDAVVYRVDSVPAGGCDKEALLIFPRQDWETTISGLALIPGSLTEPAYGNAGNPITFDGSHTYTLEATCAGGSIEAGPATLATVLAHINDIPPGSDQNFPDGDNLIIGSPSPFPGYEGFPWLWVVSNCGPIGPPPEDYERHIIASYQRGTNLRIGASDSSLSAASPGSS